MREETKNWLEQAKEDLDTAKANNQIKKYHVAAFFSQQCAEKALKAVGIEKLREIPRTHSLIELGDKMNAMHQLGVQMEKKIAQFVRNLRKNYHIIKVILFGSRARGDYLAESDYDFIVVSNDFEGVNFVERMTDVFRKCNVRFGADILYYTKKEFEKKRKQICIVREAVREGIVLVG